MGPRLRVSSTGSLEHTAQLVALAAWSTAQQLLSHNLPASLLDQSALTIQAQPVHREGVVKRKNRQYLVVSHQAGILERPLTGCWWKYVDRFFEGDITTLQLLRHSSQLLLMR